MSLEFLANNETKILKLI